MIRHIIIIILICIINNLFVDDVEAIALKSKIKYITLDMDAEERRFDIEDNVRYYNYLERMACLVIIRDGCLYNVFGSKIDTTNRLFVFKGKKYYLNRVKFVMDVYGNIFLKSVENITNIKHSQYLAGAPVAHAGLIEIQEGRLVAFDTDSGHYRPANFHALQVINELIDCGIINFQIEHLFKRFLGKNLTLIVEQYLNLRYSAQKEINQYKINGFKFVYSCA